MDTVAALSRKRVILARKRTPKIRTERTLLIDLYRVTKGLLKDFEPDEIEPHERRIVDVVHNYLNATAQTGNA